jgi:hypothetical protein
MTITYTYNVITSKPDLKFMEVEYSADGYPSVTIGMPLPTAVGEDPVAIIEAYAPISRWVESTIAVAAVDVPIGTTGIITYTPPEFVPITEPTIATLGIPQVPALTFEQQLGAALVKFGVLVNDPTLVPATVAPTAP